eukprot:COSAG02_NODE_41835_length_390_cov_0.955326_1_plen_79_part_10
MAVDVIVTWLGFTVAVLRLPVTVLCLVLCRSVTVCVIMRVQFFGRVSLLVTTTVVARCFFGHHLRCVTVPMAVVLLRRI